MSFSADIKKDLCRLSGQENGCIKAELLGLLKMGGVLLLRGGNFGINFKTDNAALARRVLQFLKCNYSVQTEVMVARFRRLKKNIFYKVVVLPSLEATKVLNELGLLSAGDDFINTFLNGVEERKAFLRGAFLAAGSVTNPSGDYHLEFVSENENLSLNLIKLLNFLDLKAKIMQRRSKFVVYMKNAEHIVHFLGFIGAHNALLCFENVRIIKEMRGKVNRVVNCETSNLSKIARAAGEQLTAIRYIEEKIGIDALRGDLLETARARKNFPEASLSELGLKMNGIGKSALSQRFKKIIAVAKKLGMGENHG